ncbi:MAG: U32 family peptidase, partial [Clostridia bacterium]|nr:U32 family peptidase [Clostridia bacterium]
MSKFSNLELLAPAGSMESLKAAARYGADAVYIGGPLLQLRAGQTAFTMEDIRNAASHMHSLNKKLYVAANAFTYPNEIASLVDYAKGLKDAGVDAMIVSDMGSIRAIKRECPMMEVHVSTQAN